MENLNNYYKNINSQRGEDGIIKEIFKRLNIKNGNFIEFGADDGVTLSNCKNLYDNFWNGCFIESNTNQFKKCDEEYIGNDDIICLNLAVDKEGENSFDNIMEKYFNKELDLVSIDVDGDDYEIFKSINKFLPKLFIIECNPYRNPLEQKLYGFHKDTQESLYNFNEIAKKKGYKAICYTQNIFFIQDKYANLFDTSTDLLELFSNGFKRSYYENDDKDMIKRMFTRMRRRHLSTNWLSEIIKKY